MLAIHKAQKLSDYVEQISAASVQIQSLGNDGTGDIGAGFFVAPRIIVTCAHVLGITPQKPHPDLRSIVVHLGSGQRFYATILDYDASLDAAVVYVNSSTQIAATFLNLGNSGTIKEGEAIVSVGSPLGFLNSVSEGIVSRKNTGDRRYFLMDCRTNPGNSGGLIYSLDKQAVIGIAAAVLNSQRVPSDGLSVGIGIDAIKQLLKRNNIKFRYNERDID
jgi:serine protease Do